MKNLYRPRLKDIAHISRQAKLGSGKAKLTRQPLRPRLGAKKNRRIRFPIKGGKKLLGALVLVILILAGIAFLVPQFEKMKVRKEEERRLAEETRRQAILLEIKKRANSPQEFFDLGLGFLKQGETLPAELALKEAIQLEPYFRDAHLYLGYTYFKTNQLHLAESTARRAIELDPTFPYSHLLLAEILKNRDRGEEAAESLKRAQVLGKENLTIGGE